MAFNPPHTNGVMELTEVKETTIKEKLQVIVDTFVATDDKPLCNTQYITETYNKANVGNEINGDTCQALLAPVEGE